MLPKVTFHPPIGEGFKAVIDQMAPQQVATSIGVVRVQANGRVDLPFPCEVVVNNLGRDGPKLSCHLPAVKILAIGRGHEAVVNFPGNQERLAIIWES